MAAFHPFPRLPYELRLLIWEMTVDPRIVKVEYRRLDPTHEEYCLTSSTPVPAVLAACQEARNHGLYQKAFSEIAVPEHGSQYVWTNLGMDIVDIGTSLLKHYKPVAHLIHRLKIEREMKSEWFYYSEIFDVEDFVNLKEIYIVPSDGLSACVGATEEHYWPCGEENVFYIDPTNNERVFRGGEGEGEIDMLYMILQCFVLVRIALDRVSIK